MNFSALRRNLLVGSLGLALSAGLIAQAVAGEQLQQIKDKGVINVGLEGTVAASLTAAGWPVKSSALASEKDIEDTFVYYSDPLNEDVARGLAIALGVGKIRLISADTFPATPITIVLGTDYPVPTPAG